VQDQVRFVVDRFNSMLESDGAALEVVSLDGGVLRLRYVAGPAGDCQTCVLEPDDLQALISEAVVGTADVTAVEVLR
jgi:hypothetical protein